MDTTKTVTHIGLCAGYGGIELGLGRVLPNLRSVALCEIEGFAIANLVAKMEAGLMDPAPVWPDLKTFPWGAFRDRVDILTGGYPCQPFSAAGKRAGKDDPRHLWPYIADGIRLLRPRLCFFENVEGHISLGLSDVIEDLAGMGYRTTWGIFSAAEVGAPHQRKRVFILAHRKEFGLPQLTDIGDGNGTVRTTPVESAMANSDQSGLEGCIQQGITREKGSDVVASGCCRTLADTNDFRGGEDQLLSQLRSTGVKQSSRCPRVLGAKGKAGEVTVWPSRPGEQQYGWEPPRVVEGRCHSEAVADGHRLDRSAPAEGREHDRQAGSAGEVQRIHDSVWKTEPPMGLHADECSGALGQTLTLTPHGDNVDADKNISKKARARQVLFEVWQQARTEGFQWEVGRLQRLLAEEILRSGVQLDSFTQRICFFVWCLQTGHPTQGWGLHRMQVYESSRSASQGQEPIEQLKRELGYAMCQLSYEIALERGQDSVETTGIVQGVRESSERAWALSQALPEMEEVWRSTLDQTVWENGCFVEATSTGNRTDELRLLGNGVVPATAERAFKTLITELFSI